MICEFCGQDGARPRRLPLHVMLLAVGHKIPLCPDCWNDLQLVIQPIKKDE
jgi:hypothetical protein